MALTPKCFFRIIGLTEEQLTLLEKGLPTNIQYRTGSDHKDRKQKLIRLILDEAIHPKLLLNLLSESPKNIYYDFFIAVSSEEESVVVDIPEYILNLRENVGGKICFSYTFV